MRAVLPTILLILATSTGCGDGPPAKEQPEPSPPELAVCPVEGTCFRPAHGIEVKVGDRCVLVCSPGCAFRLEIDPTILEATDR